MRKQVFILFILIISFHTYSDKLSYNEFITRSYETEMKIKQYDSELNAANSEVKKASAKFFPKIDFTSSYTYQQNPMEPIYINTSDFAGLIPGFGNSSTVDRIKIIDSPEPNYFDFGLKITQPIFTWGKISNGKRIYETLSDVKFIEQSNYKKELATKIKIYYYTLAILTKTRELVQNQIVSATILKELTQQNYNNGFIEYSTLLEIEYLSVDLERGFNEIKYQLDNSLNNLKYIINDNNLTLNSLNLDVDLNYSKLKTDYSQNEIEELLNKSGKLTQLDEVKKIKELELKISRGSSILLPDLALQIDMNYSGSRLPLAETDWFRKDKYGLNFSFAIKTTLFDGGESWNDTKLKSINLNGIAIQRDNLYNTLHQNVNEKIYKLEFSKLKLNNLNKRIDLTRSKKELSQIKFNQGLILESELIEDDIEYNLDYINYYNEMLNFYIDYFTLENLLEN